MFLQGHRQFVQRGSGVIDETEQPGEPLGRGFPGERPQDLGFGGRRGISLGQDASGPLPADPTERRDGRFVGGASSQGGMQDVPGAVEKKVGKQVDGGAGNPGVRVQSEVMKVARAGLAARRQEGAGPVSGEGQQIAQRGEFGLPVPFPQQLQFLVLFELF